MADELSLVLIRNCEPSHQFQLRSPKAISSIQKLVSCTPERWFLCFVSGAKSIKQPSTHEKHTQNLLAAIQMSKVKYVLFPQISFSCPQSAGGPIQDQFWKKRNNLPDLISSSPPIPSAISLCWFESTFDALLSTPVFIKMFGKSLGFFHLIGNLLVAPNAPL